MAKSDVLKHIEVKELQSIRRWRPWSVLTQQSPSDIVGDIGRRHRSTLTSAVEYDIFDPYDGPIHPAHEHARLQLVHHLYGAQERIARDLLSGLYGGASTEDLIELVNDLRRSMREND